ncbi:hypothetical protein CYY_001805 [Polysphondylium violaceum]|uniref:Uncharacterized protein n=1 Tax=Polysphondylium violaceum TaxID=133409 RepID=A0A8J4Q2F3_9MYCE|nr:hypothetical protein CYY_001805 [Polysphondylium violaceum]
MKISLIQCSSFQETILEEPVVFASKIVYRQQLVEKSAAVVFYKYSSTNHLIYTQDRPILEKMTVVEQDSSKTPPLFVTCSEFKSNQWRPTLCIYCFLPKSKHFVAVDSNSKITATATTTTTTTSSTSTTTSSALGPLSPSFTSSPSSPSSSCSSSQQPVTKTTLFTFQSSTISTTTTSTLPSPKLEPLSTPNNLPKPLLRKKSKSLPHAFIPKISKAVVEKEVLVPSTETIIIDNSDSYSSGGSDDEITPCTFTVSKLDSPSILKPTLVEKECNEKEKEINNNNNTITSSVSITISTSKSSSSLISSPYTYSAKSNSIETSSPSMKPLSLIPPLPLLSSSSPSIIEDEITQDKQDIEEEKNSKTTTTTTTSKRNSIQPLRLKSFSFSASSSIPDNAAFEDDPFLDFEDLVDDDEEQSQTTTFSISTQTPSQTTTFTSTTTILHSPRLIEKTTTTNISSSITTTSNNIVSTTPTPTPLTLNSSPSTNSRSINNNSQSSPTIVGVNKLDLTQPQPQPQPQGKPLSSIIVPSKRRSIKMDQFKEKEDDWDQGMDLTSFLKKKNSIQRDYSYCSNKFNEISSVKDEFQRQSIDFGGSLHPNAFEAFKGILDAKQKQIKKAFERKKIDEDDCLMLIDELNTAKELLQDLLISDENELNINNDSDNNLVGSTTPNQINNNLSQQSICIQSDSL